MMDTNDEMTKLMIDSFRPSWKPNDIIRMFHEERAKIEQRGQECKNLLSETNGILKEALTLRDLYSFISPKTSQLHSECKNLIQERNDLRESFDKINYTLYRQEELRNIFKRMPEIKNQVFSILNNVSQNFQDKFHKGNVASELTPLEEYYSQFFVECRRIKDMTSQLESCLACANTEELTIYLEEIYTLYVDIREQLMEPVFTRNLQKLIEVADRNYCDLLQQSCASLIRIMRNEIQLFQQVFPTQPNPVESTNSIATPSAREQPDSILTTTRRTSSTLSSSSSTTIDQFRETSRLKTTALRELLELMCRIFHEHLRPVIIHINHLETLAELHKLISETIRLEFNDNSFQATMNTLTGDIQERMVFRTEVFMKEAILDYKPSGGDLAYPEKFDLIPGGDLNDYQSMWYPTVQRTVLAMFYLNRVFDKLTFGGLARELVTACYKSLDDAQRLVDQRHGGSKIDASLFLSKHLAIIVNQLQSYGIDHTQLQPPPPMLAVSGSDSNQPNLSNRQVPERNTTSSNIHPQLPLQAAPKPIESMATAELVSSQPTPSSELLVSPEQSSTQSSTGLSDI